MESNELTQAVEKAKEKIRNLILDIDDIFKKLKLKEVKNEDAKK
jgi:hypothetical protein